MQRDLGGSVAGTAAIIASSGGISCVSTSTCGSLNVINDPPNVQIFSGGPNILTVDQPFSTNGSFSDNSTDGPWTAIAIAAERARRTVLLDKGALREVSA